MLSLLKWNPICFGVTVRVFIIHWLLHWGQISMPGPSKYRAAMPHKQTKCHWRTERLLESVHFCCWRLILLRKSWSVRGRGFLVVPEFRWSNALCWKMAACISQFFKDNIYDANLLYRHYSHENLAVFRFELLALLNWHLIAISN